MKSPESPDNKLDFSGPYKFTLGPSYLFYSDWKKSPNSNKLVVTKSLNLKIY